MIQPGLKAVSVITIDVGAKKCYAVIIQRVVIKQILRREMEQAAAWIDCMADNVLR